MVNRTLCRFYPELINGLSPSAERMRLVTAIVGLTLLCGCGDDSIRPPKESALPLSQSLIDGTIWIDGKDASASDVQLEAGIQTPITGEFRSDPGKLWAYEGATPIIHAGFLHHDGTQPDDIGTQHFVIQDVEPTDDVSLLKFKGFVVPPTQPGRYALLVMHTSEMRDDGQSVPGSNIAFVNVTVVPKPDDAESS